MQVRLRIHHRRTGKTASRLCTSYQNIGDASGEGESNPLLQRLISREEEAVAAADTAPIDYAQAIMGKSSPLLRKLLL